MIKVYFFSYFCHEFIPDFCVVKAWNRIQKLVEFFNIFQRFQFFWTQDRPFLPATAQTGDFFLVQYSTYSTGQHNKVQYSTVQYSTVQYSTIQHTIESETYHHKHIDIVIVSVIVSVLFGTVDFGLCNSLVERYHCLKWCRFIFSVWKTIIFNCGFSIKFTCGII